MATVRVWPITLSLWLLYFQQLPIVESTWNCSLKAQTYYVYYYRRYYCYKTSSNIPRVPSIEGQDIALLDNHSSRSNKVTKCAQAAMGRGYKYFALFDNGECRSSWKQSDYSYYGYERTTRKYCYYYCYYYCYSRCYYYLTRCGDGYGSSTKMNVYTFDYSYDVMIWIQIQNNNFTTHFDMFDASSPDYVSVNETISTWLVEMLDTEKICGVGKFTLQWFRPETPTTSVAHYLFPTSFQDIGHIAEQLIGQTPSGFEAEIIEVQQKSGRCYSNNPYVNAYTSFSKSYKSPTVYRKADTYYVRGDSSFYCSYSESYKWDFYRLESDNVTIGANTTMSKSESWYLYARTLLYGLYFVQFTAKSPDNPRQIGYDYGFLEIVEGPLYAYISQGSYAVYIEKKSMTLDASDSYDPDFYDTPGNYDNMNFTWVCWKSSDSFPDLDDLGILNEVYPDGSNPTPPEGSEVVNSPGGGCFNTGPGKISADNNISITFDNSLMLLGYTYYMALVVQKGHRKGDYRQKIILAKAPPKFNISCFSNCQPNAIISQRIGLEAYCVGPDCSRTLYFKWFMYESDKTFPGPDDYNATKNFYSNLLTTSTSSSMLLQENFLEERKSYMIKFRVTTVYDAKEFTYYYFRTNNPPEGGTCTMDRDTGKAALDQFDLACINWIDQDEPLAYQVNIPSKNESNGYIVFAVLNTSATNLRLPVGDETDLYNLHLDVYIIDSLGATAKVNLTVIVYPPTVSELDMGLSELVRENGALDAYVEAEDQQRAVQLSLSVLSTLDFLQESNNTDIRQNIINRITHLKINDTGSVNQIASVLVEATKVEGEITPQSGLQSLGSCENMSDILSQEGNNTATTDLIENAGKKIIAVTGNVLGGAVYTHTENATKLEDLAKKALKISETIGRYFLRRLLPGRKPMVFRSKHLSMQLAKLLVGGEDNKTRDMSINGGTFQLPDLPFLSDSTHSYLDRSIQFSDVNPFIWAKNGTYKAATSVISLSFKDEFGKPITVEKTEKQIEIYIPTGRENNDSNKAAVHFVNPGNDSMMFHSFEIKHNDTAFAIRIEPANETMLAVYLRHGRKPNLTHFDFKFIIPDFTSCVLPGQENCSIVSDFMTCVETEDAPYKDENYTRPFLPKSCDPKPENETATAPPPAPPESGEEKQTFECPDVCKYDTFTYDNCTCDELPDVTFLFNSSLDENNDICKAFIDFSLCPNDTLICKNSVNLLSCYVLHLDRFKQCRSILKTTPELFYGIYAKCLKDPFRVFFNSTVGKAGKWYVGIEYYIPPNDTNTEKEEENKDSLDFGADEPDWDRLENLGWWRTLRRKNDEDKARSFLERKVLRWASWAKWRTSFQGDDVYDQNCWFWWGKWFECGKIFDRYIGYWKLWQDKEDDGDDDEQELDRKRRSLSSDSDETAERLCVVVEEKPPPFKIGETLPLVEEPPELDENVSALYSFDVSLYTCLFWNETTEEWSTRGCTAGPESNDEKLQCLCDHLTSFGGDLLVTPNTIDFDKVALGFANLGKTGNVGVIIAVFVFVLLYVVGVIFARRADRRDKQQLSIAMPVHTNKTGDHTYEIAVYTGMFGNSGTTANVSMYISGEKGESEVLPLQDTGGAKRPFSRGSVSSFVARLPNSLGRLNYVNVWHDNSGSSPSWNLRQIVIRHVPTNKKSYFICNRWLAVEKDDGLVERAIFVADQKQMTGFQNLFYNRASKDIGDGHLWFSVYTRPPHSSFTRVQRLTCCISLLFSSMVANAMFYELGDAEESLQIKFGPIDFTWRQLMIGIQSSIIVVPVNLLIITIFRFTRPRKPSEGEEKAGPKGQEKKEGANAKPKGKTKPKDEKGKEGSDCNKSKGKKGPTDQKSKDKNSSEPKAKDRNEADSETKTKKEELQKTNREKTAPKSEQEVTKRRKFKLPYWCNYIAYTLAFLTSFVGALFTIFYSMVWGKEKSDKWILSVIISLVQDIFFVQPLKVILVASILAMLLRKPPEDEEEEIVNDEAEETKQEQLTDETSVDGTKDPRRKLFTSGPDPIIVAIAREKKLKEAQMCNIFSQLALQFFFVFLLSVATYGSRGGDRFYLSKNVQDIFNTKLGKVKDVYTFWWWAENYMLPSLYATEWYNGQAFEEEDFFSNKKMFIVGLPRLRQARIKQEPCVAWNAYPEFTRWFPSCYHSYSSDSQSDQSAGAQLDWLDVSPAYVVGGSSWRIIDNEESKDTTSNLDNTQLTSNNDSISSNSTNTTLAPDQDVIGILTNGDSNGNGNGTSKTFAGPEFRILCTHSLEYHDALSLGTLPLVTERNTYKGGGLLADLGYDIETAQEVLANLKDDIWINRLTRLVSLEFVAFETGTNLFAYVRYNFECLPTGGIWTSYRIDPISFVGSVNSSFSSIFIVCYVLIVIILLYSIYREFREMRQLKSKYFKDIWNYIEWAFISFTITTIVLFFFKSEYTRRLVEKVQENPYARMSFDYVALWTDTESVFLALVIFLATMKFLRILKFNKHIAIVTKSMAISKGPLLSYSVCFVVALLGFATFGNITFGSSAYMFSTFPRSIVNSFEMILGKGTNYDELESINRFLGPFFFFTYFLVTTLILMNFFVAIINDSFTDAREILEAESTGENMSDFIEEYAKDKLKEISDELRAMIGGQEKNVAAGENKRKKNKTWERDFFLY